MVDHTRLGRVLGYRFRNPTLLAESLAHRSSGSRNYERLEFLGDSLLNFVVAEALFVREPDLDEGSLTRLRASLVRRETLADIARERSLGDYLTLGTGELRSGGFERDSILADVVESLVGAVLLDGGFEAARSLVLELFAGRLENRPDVESLKDPKTRLQELLQGRGLPLPVYTVDRTTGASHRPEFTVTCALASPPVSATGKAASRRKAEQAAAAELLEKRREWLPDEG